MLRVWQTGRDCQVLLHQRRRGDQDLRERGVAGEGGKQSSAGEVEERSYTDGKLNGQATVLYTDSSKEMRTYKDNKLTGPASLFSASGERIEFEYCDGVVHGPAKIKVRTSLGTRGMRLLLT